MPDTPEDAFMTSLAAEYRRVGDRFHVEIDGKPAAWVDLVQEPEAIDIRLIMVRPEARRHGVGRSIVGRLAATADACGTTLVLSLAHDEPWLQDLYERAGFEISHELSQGDEVAMVRTPHGEPEIAVLI